MNPILLIVDDDPIGREALESVLITQDYTLAFAANGVEALAQARELMPDVILLDVMMPDVDGYEVCRRLREDPHVGEVPVVMVTALDDRASRLRGIEAGADDFITKPIDRAELRARVRTITRLNRYRRLQEERAKLERQLERLTALRTIDLAITASMDLPVTLEILLQQATARLGVDAASILLFDAKSMALNYAVGCGFRTSPIVQSKIELVENGAEHQMIIAPNLNVPPTKFVGNRLIDAENFLAYFRVPLLSKGQMEGVLELFHRSPLDPDREWFDFMEAIGDQAAIAIENVRLFNDLQRSNTGLMMAYDATIEGWSRALDLRDKETEGHTQRVTDLTIQLARLMGVSESDLVHVRWGALLHDIGKLGVPDNILLKPGPLTDEEWVIMRKHPVYAYELLLPISYLSAALDIPYAHHERWDGTGYPRGLKGEEIPFAARIFAIVDVWDALTSDRPYRPACSTDEALEYIQEQYGKHFCPVVVDEFIRMIKIQDVGLPDIHSNGSVS